MVGLILEREFNEALHFIIDVLPSRMTEEQYVAELQSARGWDVDPLVHKELIILLGSKRSASIFATGSYLERHSLISPQS
jgi:hypothetical protein